MTPFLVEFLVGRKPLPTLAFLRPRERLCALFSEAETVRRPARLEASNVVRASFGEKPPLGELPACFRRREPSRHCFDASGRACSRCLASSRNRRRREAAQRSTWRKCRAGKLLRRWMLGWSVPCNRPLADRGGKSCSLFSSNLQEGALAVCQRSQIRGQLIVVVVVSRGSDHLRMWTSGGGDVTSNRVVCSSLGKVLWCQWWGCAVDRGDCLPAAVAAERWCLRQTLGFCPRSVR